MNELLKYCTGFEWDKGNSRKNWIRHQVTRNECEQVFFNEPKIINEDKKHSQFEKRFYLLGITDRKRFLFLVFVLRGKLIRIISARDMSKKERRIFNEKAKRNSNI
jgi:uncharacterized DUF497 family protein